MAVDLPNDPLYTLGGVVFSPKNRPITSKATSRDFTWAVQERIGGENPIQPTGFNNKTITFQGVTFPSIGLESGKPAGIKQIDELESLMAEGIPYPLVDGNGVFYGLYAILSINDSQEDFVRGGAYLSGTFDITLMRYVSDAQGGDGRLAPNGAFDLSKWRDTANSMIGALTNFFR